MAGELIPRSNAKLVSVSAHLDFDHDIYDLRRQMEARQNIRDYIRTEIERLKAFDQQLIQEITCLDLQLRNRKPAGEPTNKKYLYQPGTVMDYKLKSDEGGAIEGEIVQ